MTHVATTPLTEPLGLSQRDAALLDFEETAYRAEGTKETEIRERFDLSTPAYYQILNNLLDDPHALAYKPMLVKRLRRQREKRHQERSTRHLPAAQRQSLVGVPL